MVFGREVDSRLAFIQGSIRHKGELGQMHLVTILKCTFIVRELLAS